MIKLYATKMEMDRRGAKKPIRVLMNKPRFGTVSNNPKMKPIKKGEAITPVLASLKLSSFFWNGLFMFFLQKKQATWRVDWLRPLKCIKAQGVILIEPTAEIENN